MNADAVVMAVAKLAPLLWFVASLAAALRLKHGEDALNLATALIVGTYAAQLAIGVEKKLDVSSLLGAAGLGWATILILRTIIARTRVSQ